MNRPYLAGVALALCGPALAQGSMTTPPGGLPREGGQFAYFPGWYANARYQQVDGMHTGSKASTITQISFRLDNAYHTSYTAMGRTWTRITLDISETSNYAGMSQTWSQNITSTPNRVFDTKWSWPGQTGFPVLKPDVWGGVKGQLRFPFTKPWGYTGKNEILMDYVFRGGTLANNGFWWGTIGVGYRLDSENLTTTDKPGWAAQLRGASGACSDSAVPVFSGGAYTTGVSYAFGAASTTVTLRNKLGVYHYSYYTAPAGAPVIHAMGLGGSTNGVSIGARCNPLFVDFSKPVVLVHLKTLGIYGYSGLMGWTVPWNQAFASRDIHVQAAWVDSKTKAFSLTTAVKLTLPDSLPWPFLARYKTAYSVDPDGTLARSIPYTSSYYFPYTQYKTR